ncbi:phage tail protein [Canibacter sp. lx-72]|uniref:phage tail protein n=1 Tax=Canibacter zhuwentaonis TaxID=2837491 RepID=UPI001BDC5247|nr:phage tail protein [Canibacter zhuwentaonis]MBT1017610.1 phage tail protein [Canibacter zhuwentaonis]
MFTLDGTIQARRDLNLHLASPVKLSPASRVVEQIVAPGREGTLTREQGWNDRVITLDLIIRSSDVMGAWCKAVVALTNAQRIAFRHDTDVFYQLKSATLAELVRVSPMMGQFQATFTCDPFVYLTKANRIVLTKSGNITNPGNAVARPVFTVYGSGRVFFETNGYRVDLKIDFDQLTVDSALLECRKGNVAQNQNMTGPFPTIRPGKSYVQLGPGISQLVIEPRWRNQ